jgi:hypothetical protein
VRLQQGCVHLEIRWRSGQGLHIHWKTWRRAELPLGFSDQESREAGRVRVSAGGVRVSAGGFRVSAGGVRVSAGGVRVSEHGKQGAGS